MTKDDCFIMMKPHEVMKNFFKVVFKKLRLSGFDMILVAPNMCIVLIEHPLICKFRVILPNAII